MVNESHNLHAFCMRHMCSWLRFRYTLKDQNQTSPFAQREEVFDPMGWCYRCSFVNGESLLFMSNCICNRCIGWRGAREREKETTYLIALALCSTKSADRNWGVGGSGNQWCTETSFC